MDKFEDEFENEGDDDESNEDVEKGDGLADMMSKILNQKVGDKIPVLAKRKTAMMKEVEGSRVDSDKSKRQRLEKKAEKEKQLVIPDASSADFERQLRKLATRGVVALFNAIAKTKKEAAEKEAAEKSKEKSEEPGDTEVHRPGVKQMTHENFLAMLKGLPEGKKDDATEDFAAAASGAEKRELDSIKKSARAKAATVIGGTQGSSGSSSSGAGAPAAGVTWNALLDDYPLAGQSMALKDWDKDDDDDNDDNEDGNKEDGISDIKEGGLRMTSSKEMEQQQKANTAAQQKTARRKK